MCADEQGRFWDYHDAIFARAGRLSEGSFEEIRSELGLDADAFDACVEERRYREFVERDFAAGEAAGLAERTALTRSPPRYPVWYWWRNCSWAISSRSRPGTRRRGPCSGRRSGRRPSGG